MPRSAQRSVLLLPAAVALVVIALLLVMVTMGKDDDTTSSTEPTAAGLPTELPELSEGFEAIAPVIRDRSGAGSNASAASSAIAGRSSAETGEVQRANEPDRLPNVARLAGWSSSSVLAASRP